MSISHTRCFVVSAVFLASIAGCSERAGPGPAGGNQQGRAVVALIAASTKNAIEEIAAKFKAEQGVETAISPGPSNALAGQILAGGDADLLLSANAQWADAVEKAGHAGKRRDLLTNDLVLVVPKGNPAQVKSPADLTTERVKKVALAGEKVPAGMYADQALAALKLTEELAKQQKLVRGHDVRSTLAYVERGEVEAGIVYSTDAMISKEVESVHSFDPKLHERIVYPVVLVKAAQERDGAKRFYDYLASPAAAEVFKRHGFELIGE
jgi:molybdate transport system substrate-binding protein